MQSRSPQSPPNGDLHALHAGVVEVPGPYIYGLAPPGYSPVADLQDMFSQLPRAFYDGFCDGVRSADAYHALLPSPPRSYLHWVATVATTDARGNPELSEAEGDGDGAELLKRRAFMQGVMTGIRLQHGLPVHGPIAAQAVLANYPETLKDLTVYLHGVKQGLTKALRPSEALCTDLTVEGTLVKATFAGDVVAFAEFP